MKLTRRTCLSALLGTMPPDLYAAAQGTHATVVDEPWTDTVRGRTLPLKLRWPDAAVHGEPYPVLLFSHGLGGTREGGAVWA